MTTPIERVLAAAGRLDLKPKRSGDGWACRCPAHDDRNPSLSIGTGDDGRALLKCHAGCATDAVLAALGLTFGDLMTDDNMTNQRRDPQRIHRDLSDLSTVNLSALHGTNEQANGKKYATSAEAVAARESSKGPSDHQWEYHDGEGELVGLVLRWNGPHGTKDILPVAKHGNRWRLKAMPQPRPLYRLPDLVDADFVIVVEGEKCADAIESCGYTATTSAGGSEAAACSDWEALAGKQVVIVPDNDKSGWAYAETVASLALKAGAAGVRIIDLAERWPDLPEKGDIVDVLAIEGGDAERVRTGIEALIERAAYEELEPDPALNGFAYTPYPVHTLPEPMRTFVVNNADVLGCDPAYIALPLLAALASAIGNTKCIELGDRWHAPATIWAVIVGESGTMKSPAIEVALEQVVRSQRHAFREYKEQLRCWKLDHDHWAIQRKKWEQTSKGTNDAPAPEEPAKPLLTRFRVEDTTIEALAVILAENSRGVLLAMDELAGWILGFNKYRGAQGGDAQQWLQVFEARDLTVDRKSLDMPLFVTRANVSVTGGVQPGTLARVLVAQHLDSGLAARLLFAYPPRRPKKWTGGSADPDARDRMTRVFERLYALPMTFDEDGVPTPSVVRLSPEAAECWREFVNAWGLDQMEHYGDEAAAWSKLEAYAGRIALVFHEIMIAAEDDRGHSDRPLHVDTLRAAIELVKWHSGECLRVYRMMRQGDDEREMFRLCDFIRGKGGSITVRELQRTKSGRYARSKQAEDALGALVNAGSGEWIAHKPGRPGPRSRIFRVYDSSTNDKRPPGGAT